MDTTSLYFEGAGGQTLGQHGYSKDHRPDLRQMILAVLIDGDGRPVCSEMWPGHTADVTTLVPMIDRLRRRFDIARRHLRAADQYRSQSPGGYLCYKQLWTVEQSFRTAKHLFSTRPIFHKLDETIRGHVFCSFLALVLKSELEERIAGLGRSGSWPEIIADLDSLAETEIEYDGKRFILRSAPRPAASLALRAAGVALPPTVRDVAAS
jgi:hypothetical protein